jgi:cation-transporting ATPase F
LIFRIALVSLFITAGAVTLFEWELLHGASNAEARTVVVNVIVMVEAFYLLNCRSLSRPFFSLSLFSNPWVVAGFATMIAAQLLFTYAPFMHVLFHSAPIRGLTWLKIIGVGLVVFVMIEGEKWRDARRRASAPETPQG